MNPYFLLSGTMGPRLTLLFAWLTDTMPANNTPLWLDMILSLLAPRLLIASWAYSNQEHWIWPTIYILEFLGFISVKKFFSEINPDPKGKKLKT